MMLAVSDNAGTSSEQTRTGGWHVLRIDQHDAQTGLAVRTRLPVLPGRRRRPGWWK